MPTHKVYGLFSVLMLFQTISQCSIPPSATIRGTIQLTQEWKPMVYLVQPRNFAEIASNFGGIVLDSAHIASDGTFVFSPQKLNSIPMLFQLCIQKTGNRFPTQLLDDAPLAANYMPIVLQENTTLDITAQADQFQATFNIKNPAAENRALLQLRNIRHKAWQQEQSWLTAANHIDEHTLLEHEAALLRFQIPIMAFADSSAYYWPAFVAARWVSPTGDYERVPEFMWKQCKKWRSKPDLSTWAAQLCQAANREKLPVLIGDTIPDIPLPMLAGDTMLLHTLLGSRITVLDIWASWCAPCRRENREVLNPIWAKHKNATFQIIGYSIDSSPNAWKSAIDKDGASWPHASHLSGDATPFMAALRITTIPANFILDAQGKVIAKNLHGEALRIFVEDYLK